MASNVFTFDSSSRLLVSDLGATSIPATARWNNGFAFNPSNGSLYVSTEAVSSAKYNMGLAFRTDGALFATITAPGTAYSNGPFITNSDGAAYVADAGTISVYRNALGFTSGGAVATTGLYTASANDYDGTNDYQLRGGDLTGIADGKAGTFSAWVRIDGGDGATRRIIANAATTPRFHATLTSTNKISILARTSADTTIFNKITTPTYLAGASWLHILSSWNLAATVSHLYISDAAPALDTDTNTDGTIDYTQGNFAIGADTAGAAKFNGCLSELFFHNTYIDLSVTANRRKFISDQGKPVNLGADGSRPLGVQPLLYAPTGDASGTGNKGSGGAFTTTGSLDACSSAP